MKSDKYEEAYDLAYKYEAEKGHCAQCVLVAINEVNNIDNEDMVKAIDGLTGGTALTTEGICGALAAGIIAISSFTGRTYEDFKKNQKNHTWKFVQEFYNKFIEFYGSPIGKEVQKKIMGRSYKFTDEEEKKLFEAAGGHDNKCPSVCGNAAKWATEIIAKL